MERMTPPLLEYPQSRPKRCERIRVALALTIVTGVGAGLAAGFRWYGALLGVTAYSFCCTLAMGWLAGRARVLVAVVAAATVSGTMAIVELLRAPPRADLVSTLIEGLPVAGGIFILSAASAALALPLTTVRLRRPANEQIHDGEISEEP
jgi:hypothetical protein